LDTTIIAYLLFILADFAIYSGLVWLLWSSYKTHRLGVIAFVILVAPFFYTVIVAGSLLNLLWVLFFTPFYGVIVMILVYPIWMLLYYVISLVSLVVLRSLLRKAKTN